MYTEVCEVVNFVCRYLFGRIPRRPTGIFASELANSLVCQFSSSWDINNPDNGQMERVVYINCRNEGSSKCFGSCAQEAGLRREEVLGHLPINVCVYASPGKVFFRGSLDGIEVPIWNGEVNADDTYQPVAEYIVRSASGRAESVSNLGAAQKPVLIGMKPLPTNDPAIHELVNNMYIPLGLEKCDEDFSNLSHMQERYPYLFAFKPSSAQTYTGLEFAQTRFGSSKSRPDLQTMLNIKQLSSQHATSSTNFSAPMKEHMIYSHY
uniref:FOG-3 n=1 Tax=Caenorhabditis remanei TaxID=31234 RepID=Q95WA5_CAERE|nr:FOG-3 [Caenorhabditis remanei]